MSSDISTIQSLKAVDAWIDVINANINGGVRTAFKSSRLKFSGSNVDVSRAGTSASLPLQFPEPGLTTANTVIDFSQGAITASTENTHLAIQGEGFFLLMDPETHAASAFSDGNYGIAGFTNFLLTRDGEFVTDPEGFLRHAGTGYYLMTVGLTTVGSKHVLQADMGSFIGNGDSCIEFVYNDLDLTTDPLNVEPNAVNLSQFLTGTIATTRAGAALTAGPASALVSVRNGLQSLRYSQFGSTVFDFGYQSLATPSATQIATDLDLATVGSESTVLSKSLEASNASMTQSVPELSLAQKLFSALTKVLQTRQTNVDGVLNLVR